MPKPIDDDSVAKDRREGSQDAGGVEGDVGELSEDELEHVSGGGDGDGSGVTWKP